MFNKFKNEWSWDGLASLTVVLGFVIGAVIYDANTRSLANTANERASQLEDHDRKIDDAILIGMKNDQILRGNQAVVIQWIADQIGKPVPQQQPLDNKP